MRELGGWEERTKKDEKGLRRTKGDDGVGKVAR